MDLHPDGYGDQLYLYNFKPSTETGKGRRTFKVSFIHVLKISSSLNFKIMALHKTGNRYVNALAIIASLGGFLFGYDTAVISGTINFVTSQFHLDAAGTGWYVSSALLGCILGVSVAGVLSDKYGRKNCSFYQLYFSVYLPLAVLLRLDLPTWLYTG